MAFWKKSEDPWDIDPEKWKRRKPVVYETENKTEEKTERKLPWQKKEPTPAVEEPPVPCPYCGAVMEKGYLIGGRDSVRWTKVKPNAIFGNFFAEAVTISDEGVLVSYKTCHMCEVCRKLIVDVPEPPVDEFAQWTQPDKESEENDT